MTLTLMLVAVLALSACTITYFAGGRYTDGGEKFYGKVNASVFGGSEFTLQSSSSDTVCSGQSDVVKRGMSCAGQYGNLALECTDGRTVTGMWSATTCTTGVGDGIDSDGRKIEFVFGLTEQEAYEFAHAP